MEYEKSPDLDAGAASAAGLGPTSFALLAQFARQPGSAYQLAQGMRRNLHYLWPRAESRIYAEVVRLQERGLLRGEAQATGRRARTVMHLTPAGRAQLAAFLAAPVGGGLVLESEALLRVYFATLGSRDDLLRALRQLRSEAAELRSVAADVGEGYLQGAGIAQEQAHVRSMMHALLGQLSLLVGRWADDCLREAEGWSDLAPEGKKKAAARRFSATQLLMLGSDDAVWNASAPAARKSAAAKAGVPKARAAGRRRTANRAG